MKIINHTKFVVIDVETTGFSNQDRIIEIALITLDSETLKAAEEYDTLINPERDITATHVHGITATMGHVYLFVQTDIAVIILVTVKEIKLDSRFWFKGDIICESQASV